MSRTLDMIHIAGKKTMMAYDLVRWMSEVRFYVFWIGGLTRVAAPTASMTEDKSK